MEESCHGKKCYHSFDHAKSVRESIYRHGRNKRLRIYKCNDCYTFHLTSAIRGKEWDNDYIIEMEIREKNKKEYEKRKRKYNDGDS